VIGVTFVVGGVEGPPFGGLYFWPNVRRPRVSCTPQFELVEHPPSSNHCKEKHISKTDRPDKATKAMLTIGYVAAAVPMPPLLPKSSPKKQQQQ
jgi:hypothetical protein